MFRYVNPGYRWLFNCSAGDVNEQLTDVNVSVSATGVACVPACSWIGLPNLTEVYVRFDLWIGADEVSSTPLCLHAGDDVISVTIDGANHDVRLIVAGVTSDVLGQLGEGIHHVHMHVVSDATNGLLTLKVDGTVLTNDTDAVFAGKAVDRLAFNAVSGQAMSSIIVSDVPIYDTEHVAALPLRIPSIDTAVADTDVTGTFDTSMVEFGNASMITGVTLGCRGECRTDAVDSMRITIGDNDWDVDIPLTTAYAGFTGTTLTDVTWGDLRKQTVRCAAKRRENQ